MPDLYMHESGDLAVSPAGDLAITQSTWRDDVQQVYVRLMTEMGDFEVYPELGASLTRLYGRPQSANTGDLGIGLIRSALDRESRFSGKPYIVKAIPTGPQSIRFDVTITSGNREQILLSVEQNLGVT